MLNLKTGPRQVTGKHVRVESSKEETILAFWQTEHKQKSGTAYPGDSQRT